MAPGLFGKLPGHGDFVSRRLPRAFVEAWDAWLQSGLAQSREQLGEGWREAYLGAPFWRFGLSGGLCGAAPAVGVLMASVDRVGRYFPLTAAAPMPDAPFAPLLPLVGGGWFAALEEALLTAFDTPFDLDAFDARIAAAGVPSLARAGATEMAAVEAIGSGLGITLPAAADGSEAGARLAHGALAAAYGRYSLWSTTGSAGQVPACLVFPGLPPPEMFAALLDGGYARAAAGASMPFEVVC